MPRSSSFVYLGHSLGLYSALVASEFLSFPDVLQLLRKRGQLADRLMSQSSRSFRTYALVSATRWSEDEVKKLKRHPKVFVMCFNSPTILLAAIESEFAESALSASRKEGIVKRAIQVPLSIPFHTPVMQSMVCEFKSHLDSIPTNNRNQVVISNVTGKRLPLYNWKDELCSHLVQPVLWTMAVEYAVNELGVESFIGTTETSVLLEMMRQQFPGKRITAL